MNLLTCLPVLKITLYSSALKQTCFWQFRKLQKNSLSFSSILPSLSDWMFHFKWPYWDICHSSENLDYLNVQTTNIQTQPLCSWVREREREKWGEQLWPSRLESGWWGEQCEQEKHYFLIVTWRSRSEAQISTPTLSSCLLLPQSHCWSNRHTDLRL